MRVSQLSQQFKIAAYPVCIWCRMRKEQNWKSKTTICNRKRYFNRFWCALVNSRNSLRLPPIRCVHGAEWEKSKLFCVIYFIRLMRRGGLVSTGKSSFKRACAAIQWSQISSSFSEASSSSIWAGHEKTCLRNFRPGKTQTSLLSHRCLVEAWNFGYKK